jgi:hypothetical protein
MNIDELYENLCTAQGFLIMIKDDDGNKKIKKRLDKPMKLLLDIQVEVLAELKSSDYQLGEFNE